MYGKAGYNHQVTRPGKRSTELSRLNDYPDFLERHPDVPWRNMKGMRNRIAHGYFDINLDVVWETIQTALPALLDRLPAIREEARQDELA